MRHTVILAAAASFVLASTVPSEPLGTIRAVEYVEDDVNNTLEKRKDPVTPGWFECKQGGFKKPCTWTAAGGKGALDCHRLIYGDIARNPGMSFGPDKGVVCRFYDTKDCGVLADPLNVHYPGGDLLALGRKAGIWGPNDVEGFSSFRCRSWQQKENDEAQSKYIKLPDKP